MTRTLAAAGIRVPLGFATTAATYRTYIEANELAPKLRKHLDAYHHGKQSLARPAPPFAGSSSMQNSPHRSPNPSAPRTGSLRGAAARRRWRWLFAAARPRRICRRRASPGSRKLT